ncbi:hypothetical protein [Desulfovibrio sp. DV]|uniref:hypothetical protein n=1 Tax=Desulfovibrio sp. DV TaxID=1844708 RepID=UPI000AA3B264|nr:hypothetical protein [Desulfovibrio sp. DV]
MRLLRRIFICLGSLSILVFSFVCFAADDSILTFIPALVKAQTSTDPIGTYNGSGVVTFGGCACRITNATVVVGNGPIADTYTVSYSGLNTTDCVANYGQCSWSDTGSNLPAAMKNKELVFGSASKGSYDSQGVTYTYKTSTTGFLDLSNSIPVFTKNSAHQVTGPPDNAYNALVRLTLQKAS